MTSRGRVLATMSNNENIPPPKVFFGGKGKLGNVDKASDAMNHSRDPAAKVFGPLVVMGDDDDNGNLDENNESLCYSPSPVAGSDDGPADRNKPRSFVFEGTGLSKGRGGNRDSNDGGSDSISSSSNSSGDDGTGIAKPMKKSKTPTRKNTTKIVVRDPFSLLELSPSRKENHEDRNVDKAKFPKKKVLPRAATQNDSAPAGRSNSKSEAEPKKSIAKKSEWDDIIQDTMAAKKKYNGIPRSPLCKEMRRRTQEAVDMATVSVNSSLNAVRVAKAEHVRGQKFETARLREQLRAEKLEAAAFHSEATRTKRELMEMRTDLASRIAREKAEKARAVQRARLDEIDRESQFKSEVFRDHQKTLKESEEERRRRSMEVRSKIRQENREGEFKMRMARIEEEKAVFEQRQLQSAAAREAQREEAKRRRESFAFRNGDARRIRQLHAEMEAQRWIKEHESYELKWAGERDAEEYKKEMAEKRRQSLAFRNAEGRRQREEENLRAIQELDEEHKSYELKWEGQRDAEEHKRRMEEERRKSLEFRNAEGRRQRDLEMQMKIDEQEAQHESYELKWAAEKDAEEYQKELARRRRESLALRNKEGFRHRELMKELHSIAREQESESLMLKWAGEEDAKKYLDKLAQQRRDSLAFRNAEGKRHRDLDAEAHRLAVEQAAADEELKASAAKDVAEYNAECRERDRASLAFRGKEIEAQKIKAGLERQKEKEKEEEMREMEDGARDDVRKYVEKCKRRRRLSLAFRAKEKRRHAAWERQQKEKLREERSRNTRAMALDSRYMELARERERARIAIDALRHAGCTFTVNPFGSLLDRFD